MAEKYTSIKVIADKIMRHPLLSDLTFETIIDYCIDFTRIVGVPRLFSDKTEILKVEKYRAKLPPDWIDTIQIRDTKTKVCLRSSTDSFNKSSTINTPIGNTFAIQGNIIYTSIEDGEIEIAYRAIEVDDNGYPLIPDNSAYTTALESYIKKEYFTILFDMSKVSSQILQNTQQEYAWRVGRCEAEFNRLDLSRAESLMNSFSTLLIRQREFDKGFINTGTKEVIKIH